MEDYKLFPDEQPLVGRSVERSNKYLTSVVPAKAIGKITSHDKRMGLIAVQWDGFLEPLSYTIDRMHEYMAFI